MLDATGEEVRRQLRGCLVAKDFDTWIAPLRATTWEDGELVVEVPSIFGLDWIREHYNEEFARALETVAGKPANLKLVVNRALEARQIARRPLLPADTRPAKRRAPESRCRFVTLVVGERNQAAVKAARAFA